MYVHSVGGIVRGLMIPFDGGAYTRGGEGWMKKGIIRPGCKTNVMGGFCL